MNKFTKLALAGVLWTAALAPQACSNAQLHGATPSPPLARPNFLVILADDLGFNDLSLGGNPLVSTPNIDSLARDGARFVRAYSADALCAPSRAGLMTGRNPQRFGFEANPLPAAAAQPILDAQAAGRPVVEHEGGPDIMPIETISRALPLDQQGIPDSEETFAQALQATGYSTGAFGKWHLGYDKGLSPGSRGFGESIVFPGGASLYGDPNSPDLVNAPFTWSSFDAGLWKRLKWDLVRDGKPTPVRKYMTYEIADDASAFIMRNKSHPFALYVAFNAPHNPLQAPRDIYDRMGHIPDHHLRVYYSAVEALDLGVGQLLEALRQAGVADNTIVIFASDNGGAVYAHNPYANLPFRGWKTTYFEGGVRVPMLVRWPSQIKPGAVVRDTVSLLDIAPTLKHLGGAGPGPNPMDGRDLSGVFRDPATRVPDRPLYYRSEHYQMIIKDDFKLQISQYPPKTWLFNLRTDPSERNNLATVMPDKVQELRTLLDARDGELSPPRWPVLVRKKMAIDGDVNPAPKDQEFVYWPLSSE